MLLSGLQRHYLSPDTPYTPRDAAVGFTKALPLPRHPVHPKGCCCRVYKGTTSPQTPRTPQGMLLSGLQRHYLSPDTPYTPRDAAVGFTKALPLPRHPVHPKGCCCRVYKGTTSPQTPRTPQGMLLWGLQRHYLSPDTQYTPRDAAVGFTKALPLPRHPVHPKGCCCRVYKGTTSPQTPSTPQGMLLSGLQRHYLSPDTPYTPDFGSCECHQGDVHPFETESKVRDSVVVCVHWATHRNWQTKLLDTRMLLLVGCLTSHPHASVSQGRICSDKFTCCHTEIEVADQTFHLTQ